MRKQSWFSTICILNNIVQYKTSLECFLTLRVIHVYINVFFLLQNLFLSNNFGYSHLILKTGDESGRGSILTDEGQETLSMAQSVLTAIVESISNASVTVEILVLLQKYKQKFLELLKTTFSTAKGETKVNAEEECAKSLTERIEEIEEFQAVKLKVVSFATMCDLIQPGEKTH